VFATDVIAILGTEPARLPVLQVGGHYRRATAERRIGGRARVPAVRTETLAGRGDGCHGDGCQLQLRLRGRPGIGW